MPVVTNTLKAPDGSVVSSAAVQIELAGTDGVPIKGYVTAGDYSFIGYHQPTVTAGVWSVTLVANTLINPSGTRWKVSETHNSRTHIYYLLVPNGAGPYFVEDILSDAPASVASPALQSHLDDTTAAHAASAVSFSPTGTVAATTVQAAIAEVDSEKVGYVTGLTTDGTGDNTAALLAAITAAMASGGGGTLILPAGTIRCDGQLLLPNDGAAVPKQRPLRLIGQGAFFAGQSAPVLGGTILDLRYSGTEGKIETRGLGALEITGVTLTDYGTSTGPFIHTTNTTLLLHHMGFVGNPSKSGTTCDQDAIVLGGTTTALDGTTGAAFQGYGTVIDSVYFNRIRRGVYFRTYANGVVVRDCTWWQNCGGVAAVEFAPLAGQFCTGNVLIGNLIEMTAYTHAVKCATTTTNTFSGNNLYDAGATVSSYYSFAADCQYDFVVAGYHSDDKTFIADASNTVSYLTSHQSQQSYLRQTFRAGILKADDATFDGGNGKMTVQPAASTADSAVLLRVLRSAAEASNPGAVVMQLQQHGVLTLAGDQGGNINFQNAAGVDVVKFTGNGKNWVAQGDGGPMSQNSGAGGSYLTLQNYGVKLLDHTGANPVTIKNGSGSPEGAFAAPPGSLWLRTDGGAGTTLYVKESGTGNTGWVAK